MKIYSERPDTNWVSGSHKGFIFQAKLFDEGSWFGINEGRVSKLHISEKATGKTILNYDRGWDICPEINTPEHSEYQKILAALENSPKRFEKAGA